MWSYWIYETKPGTQRARLYPVSVTWSTSFTGMGQSTFSLKLLDRRHARSRDDWHDLLVGNDRMFVIVWTDDADLQINPVVAYAGLLLDYEYDWNTGTLTWVTSELRGALTAKRLTFGVNVYPQGDLTITNLSYASAVRVVLERMMQWSSDWTLPLDLSQLPAGQAGPYSKATARYEVLSILDLLSDLEGRGISVFFRPVLDASWNLRFQVRVFSASAVLGNIALSASHGHSSIPELGEKGSAAKQVTGIFAIGNGTGANMLTAWAPNPNLGLPAPAIAVIRDEKRAVKTITDPTQLQDYANKEYLAARLPLIQRPFAINLEDRPNRLGVQLGLSRVQMGYGVALTLEDGDPWMYPGPYATRIMAMSGDMTNRIIPEVQNA